MERREFIKSSLFASLAVGAGLDGAGAVVAQEGARHSMAGKVLPAWKRGEFQVHFIYTGVGEALFWILPDRGPRRPRTRRVALPQRLRAGGLDLEIRQGH